MKKPNDKKTNRAFDRYDRDFSDLGIEPPKIYRESQRKTVEAQSKRHTAKKKLPEGNLTRAQKRQKETKKRTAKNRFRKTIRIIGAIVAAAAIATALSLTVFFQISNITAGGSKIYTSEQILAQCTIDNGTNLFMADTQAAAEKIEQNLPYAYKAEITRKLPDTLVIKITDAKAAYSVLCDDNTYILLDDNFKVLEKGAQKSSGIVISKADIKKSSPGYTIEFKNSDTGKCLQSLAECIKNNNYTEITAIYSNNISDNRVIYDGRITFKLGTAKNLDSKILKGLAACDKLNTSNPNAVGTMNISDGKTVYFTEE